MARRAIFVFLPPPKSRFEKLGLLVKESRRKGWVEENKEAELEQMIEESGLALAEPDEVEVSPERELVVDRPSPPEVLPPKSPPLRPVAPVGAPVSAGAGSAFAPSPNLPLSLDRSNLDTRIKQKNVQLRMDQIIALREYSFRSGNLDGHQLNESQIIRVALDLLFWLDIDPVEISTEENLYRKVEEFLGVKNKA